jgi:hypothetical protein
VVVELERVDVGVVVATDVELVGVYAIMDELVVVVVFDVVDVTDKVLLVVVAVGDVIG